MRQAFNIRTTRFVYKHIFLFTNNVHLTLRPVFSLNLVLSTSATSVYAAQVRQTPERMRHLFTSTFPGVTWSSRSPALHEAWHTLRVCYSFCGAQNKNLVPSISSLSPPAAWYQQETGGSRSAGEARERRCLKACFSFFNHYFLLIVSQS